MPSETLRVKTVIGTGDPLDGIWLLPLIVDWGVPKGCIGGAIDGEECDAPIRRLYVLEEPFQGFMTVGCCEDHHARLAALPSTCEVCRQPFDEAHIHDYCREAVT